VRAGGTQTEDWECEHWKDWKIPHRWLVVFDFGLDTPFEMLCILRLLVA
jgi:hypothetical protein